MYSFLILLFLGVSSSFAHYLDVDVEQVNNYTLQENFFLNYNSTESHKKEVSGLGANLDINLNDMGGFKYNKIDFSASTQVESKTLYIGSDETIYLSYADGSNDVSYTDGNKRDSTDNYKKFTFYDILTVEKHSYSSQKNESYVYRDLNATDDSNGSDTITRRYNTEVYRLSSEGLYRLVRKKALAKADFFYGVAGAHNFSPYFRLYGLGILSYEHHDYKNGKAYDTQGRFIKTEWGGSDLQELDQNDGINGKFKGFGYGYHVTAELHYKNLSFFLSQFYKKTKLKNYHTNVRNFIPSDDPTADPTYTMYVIRKNHITLKNQYLSFGLKYRF